MGKTAKDKRDIYYRKAKEEGYRARSAYKLLQIDEEFNLFNDHVHRVVDLCAAPGSWSQVIAKRLLALGREILTQRCIVSVDLFEIAPIEGVTTVKGDITREKTVQEVQDLFKIEDEEGSHQAQLVVSDGAPDILGDHDFDQYVQHQLVLAALNIAIRLLSPGGSFVAKIFRGKDIGLLLRQFKILFSEVYCAKPKSSRNSSIEAFVVAKGFQAPISMISKQLNVWDALTTINHLKTFEVIYHCEEEEDMEDVVPFVACGKHEELDSDMNYSLSTNVLAKDEEEKMDY